MQIFDFFKQPVKTLKEKRHVKRLVTALRHQQSDLHTEASEALIEIGEPAIEPLIHSLKHDTDYHFIKLGLDVLEKMGEPAKEHLIEAAMDCVLNDKHDHRIPPLALDTLLRLGDEEAFRKLAVASFDVTDLETHHWIEKILRTSDWTPSTNFQLVVYHMVRDTLDKCDLTDEDDLLLIIEVLNKGYYKHAHLLPKVLLKAGSAAVTPIISSLLHQPREGGFPV